MAVNNGVYHTYFIVSRLRTLSSSFRLDASAAAAALRPKYAFVMPYRRGLVSYKMYHTSPSSFPILSPFKTPFVNSFRDASFYLSLSSSREYHRNYALSPPQCRSRSCFYLSQLRPCLSRKNLEMIIKKGQALPILYGYIFLHRELLTIDLSRRKKESAIQRNESFSSIVYLGEKKDVDIYIIVYSRLFSRREHYDEATALQNAFHFYIYGVSKFHAA